MLKEAYRVLKKNGRIGCSVWGSKENSDHMTFMEKILDKNNIERPKPPRTPFHLNDQKKLVEMFEKAGFVDLGIFQYKFQKFGHLFALCQLKAWKICKTC